MRPHPLPPATLALAVALAAPLAGCPGDRAAAADAGAPPAACGEAGPCAEGTVCCARPQPCAGRCVPDCRLTTPCPAQLPTCDLRTGLCEPAFTPCVANQVLTVRNPASGVSWWAKAFHPCDAGATHPYPAVVTVPGASGAGSASEGSPDPSSNPAAQAARGFVVVIFDADGRGNTVGTEDYCGSTHQEGLRALVLAVAALPVVDATSIGISTGSFGITMGSGVLARYPDLPVRFLLDAEGPADRNDTGRCDASNTGHIDHDCADDAWWSEREAATFARQVRVPYLRMQNAVDHAQPDNLHAIRMIDNATNTSYGGNGVSPWTRVNLAGMNPANTVYTDSSPPQFHDGSAFDLPALWAELFAL